MRQARAPYASMESLLDFATREKTVSLPLTSYKSMPGPAPGRRRLEAAL